MGSKPRARVLSTLSSGRVEKVPVTSIAGCAGTVTVDMQKATGIYWPEAHKDPIKMARLSIACHDMTGIENVRVPFDFVVEPEALGCKIKWWNKMDSVPSVVGHPYTRPQDLDMPDKLLQSGRIPIILKAITTLREEVGEYLPIASLALGPFSLASELAGIGDFLRWTLKRPDYVEKFLDFVTDVVIEYGNAQYRAGSDIVEVADAVASLDMISPTLFTKFAKPALIKVARGLRGVKVLHICGRTEPILSDIMGIKFDGVSVNVDIAFAKLHAGDTKILGNVSSKDTMIFGSTMDVKSEARKALEAGVDLLEPVCGISPITPLKNIKAIVKARDEFYI